MTKPETDPTAQAGVRELIAWLRNDAATTAPFNREHTRQWQAADFIEAALAAQPAQTTEAVGIKPLTSEEIERFSVDLALKRMGPQFNDTAALAAVIKEAVTTLSPPAPPSTGAALTGWRWRLPESPKWHPEPPDWKPTNGGAGRIIEPLYAALALVERMLGKHWLWQIKKGIEFQCILWTLETDYDDREVPVGYSAASASLAILAALLTALRYQEDKPR